MIEFDERVARGVEAMYATPDVAGQRRRVIELLAPSAGEQVLDVGAGPGFLLHEMAQAVGVAGRVVGIDPSEPMLALARRRCEEQPQVELRVGEATALPFDDASFDAVVSTQVYEYVADMEKALAEVRRVLRPGGRVLILDTDWDSIVWRTSDRARMRRVLEAWDEHLADPHLPQTLGNALEVAGLAVERVEVVPLVNPTLAPDTYSFGILAAIQGFVPGRCGVEQEEAEAWADELRARGAAGEYFFSLNRYVFLARAPGGGAA